MMKELNNTERSFILTNVDMGKVVKEGSDNFRGSTGALFEVISIGGGYFKVEISKTDGSRLVALL